MWAPKGSGTGQVTWPPVVDDLYTKVGDSTQEEGNRQEVPFTGTCIQMSVPQSPSPMVSQKETLLFKCL